MTRITLRLPVFAVLAIMMVGVQASQLEDAIALYQDGDYKAASQQLQAVPPTDPNYVRARYYNALCLYQLNDDNGKKFRRQVEALRQNRNKLSAAQNEDLDYRYVVVSFKQKAFPVSKAWASDFLTTYAQSAHAEAVREIAMLSSYEIGIKRCWEAKSYDPQTQQDKNAHKWNLGRTELARFIRLAGNIPQEDSEHLQMIDRDKLKQRLWVARILSGDEDKVVAEMPNMTQVEQEKLSFIRGKLYCDYWPEKSDTGIRMLTDFIAKYPASADATEAKRLKTKNLYFQGERLIKQVNGTGTSTQHASAHEYFAQFRAYCGETFLNGATPLAANDLVELEEEVLHSYYLENDFSSLAATAHAIAGKQAAGTRPWAIDKVFEGIGLANQSPPDLEGAAAAFDAVLAAGIVDKSARDHVPTMAAFWRARVAEMMNDGETVGAMATLIRDTMPNSEHKKKALAQYGRYLQ